MADLDDLDNLLLRRLSDRGTPEQVQNTFRRITNINMRSLEDYMRNYTDSSTLIDPQNIRNIIEEYYISKDASARDASAKAASAISTTDAMDNLLMRGLQHRGNPEQIQNTFRRITDTHRRSLEDYMRDHPFDGTLITPYKIEDLIKEYYISKAAMDVDMDVDAAGNNYELINEEVRYTGDHGRFHDGHRAETWYTYKNKKTREVFDTKKKLHRGGKRKSRRNQKSKKSSKKSRKKSRKELRKKLKKSSRRR